MAGHISLPSVCPAGLPATLSRDILTGLLRNELGFNGLIVTDSSTMAGFACAMPREIAVPTAVAAGCAKLCYIILPVWCTPVNSLLRPKTVARAQNLR